MTINLSVKLYKNGMLKPSFFPSITLQYIASEGQENAILDSFNPLHKVLQKKFFSLQNKNASHLEALILLYYADISHIYLDFYHR